MSETIGVRRASGYTVIQDSVIDREDLTSSEKLAYMALCRFADKAGECWPSYAAIAKRMSASERTAIRAVKSLHEKGLLQSEKRYGSKGQTSNLFCIIEQGGVTQSQSGGDTVSVTGVTPCHPKDSQLKDSQGRKENPTESEESSEEKASESASPTPSESITASDLEEWCEDYSDLPLQHDSASLANLNRLEHDRRDIRAAIVAWLPSVRGKAPNLGWFLKQGGPQLAEAKRERLKYEEMTRSAARAYEERRRWQEEQDALTEEEREENLHCFDDLRAKLNAKVPA